MRRGALSRFILLLVGVGIELPLLMVVVGVFLSFQRFGYTGLMFLGFNSKIVIPGAFQDAKLIKNRLYRASSRLTQGSAERGYLEVSWVPLDKSRKFDDPGASFTSDELSYDTGYSQTVVGDDHHLWLLGKSRPDSAGMWHQDIVRVEGEEFIPESAMPKAEQRPMTSTLPGNRLVYEYSLSEEFILDGKLSSLYSPVVGNRELYQLIDGFWTSRGVISLLDVTRRWRNSLNETLILPVPAPPPGWGTAKDGLLSVLPIGSTAHLFWRLPGRLLHRRGFQFEESISTGALDQPKLGGGDPAPLECQEHVSSEAGVTDEWLLVSDDIPPGALWFPAIAGGDPVVVVIDEKRKGYPVAVALALKNDRWMEYSRMKLPFSALITCLGQNEEGSLTYFSATTPTRRGEVFAVGPDGLSQTAIRYSLQPNGQTGYLITFYCLAWSAFAGMMLSCFATVFMRRDTARYEFGNRTVELASVMERAIARGIDGTVFLVITAGLPCILLRTWDLDWRTTIEAMAIGVYDHPTLLVALRIAVITFLAFLVMCFLYIAMQGWFGLTPGKWVCRLRVVQTSLRPCGFAKSLLREVLLAMENLYLFTWTPAILLVAFSRLRQRFGDRLADTIVIRTRSRQTPVVR
ncbi:RDD family protein [Schlesneria sp. DSM 10557]|uniref:RDD family protein n=1 Tax=Schlesneria sp. DSM 10557 TaxID=3044399 RepID=UPI0035A135B7